MILGKCPYCEDGEIEVRDKEVRGKKVKLYACSNAHWISEDGEMYELTHNSTCHFKIWQNSLARYGKWLSYKEIRELLKDGEIEVEFLSKKYGKKLYYQKNLILDREYGVSVLWDG
jgi:Zn-finger protein